MLHTAESRAGESKDQRGKMKECNLFREHALKMGMDKNDAVSTIMGIFKPCMWLSSI